MMLSGANLWGGRPVAQELVPLATKRVPIFELLYDVHFWLAILIFLKAPSAPIYIIFEWGTRVKKRGFFACFFFSKVTCGAKLSAASKERLYTSLRVLGK